MTTSTTTTTTSFSDESTPKGINMKSSSIHSDEEKYDKNATGSDDGAVFNEKESSGEKKPKDTRKYSKGKKNKNSDIKATYSINQTWKQKLRKIIVLLLITRFNRFLRKNKFPKRKL